MIEYYTSTFNPDCFFASLDGVVVAMWHESGWMDRCIYRPVRSHYTKFEWTGPAYDPAFLVNPEEFEIVKSTGKEAPMDKEIEEVARLNAKT
jgi:hypothetical protein